MAKLVFKINDIGETPVVIKTPTKYGIDYNPITNAKRKLNAKMSIKGIAGKFKVTLTYDVIKQSELNVILGQTWDVFKSDLTMVRELTFPSPAGTEELIECYFAPLHIDYLPQGEPEDVDNAR